MTKSRIIHLTAGQQRDRSRNQCTVGIGGRVPAPGLPGQQGGLDFSELFARHYADFAPTCRAFEQPGLAVVAIDRVRGQLAGVACVAARIGAPNTIIVGRHSEADLLLDGDGTLSLRHMAIVVEPVRRLDRPGEGVAYRVIDLRSTRGFTVEGGHTLGGIRADGPAFVATDHYAFFLFVTGDRTDWPESAAEAWLFIPERVYLEESPRLAEGSWPQRLPRNPDVGKPSMRNTMVRNTLPPRSPLAGSLLGRGEAPIAHLSVVTAGRRDRVPVGTSALEAGVLLGRDDRCNASSAFNHGNLSRVHALIIDIDGTPWVIDTGSTNGIYDLARPELPLRVASFAVIDAIHLAGAVVVGWKPVSS